MSAPRKSGLMPILLGAAIIIAAMFAWKHFRPGAAAPPATPVTDRQRTATPVAEYTRFFKRKEFSVQEADGIHKLVYFWFEPQGRPYPPGLKFPLVVVLHGAPGNAYAARYLISREMQLGYPAFILIPMAPVGKIWAVPDTIDGKQTGASFRQNQALPGTVALIDDLMAHDAAIDPARIYIVGCSDGGGGAYGAAARYPDVFAAAVAMSGLWDPLGGAALRVPLWILHGALDPGMPVANTRRLAQGAKAAGAPVFYTEMPDMGHECGNPRLYTPALWKWLFQHKKKI